MKKINLKIALCDFKLNFDKLKRKFVLDSPGANNVKFESVNDLMSFVRNNYPRFVANKLIRRLKDEI